MGETFLSLVITQVRIQKHLLSNLVLISATHMIFSVLLCIFSAAMPLSLSLSPAAVCQCFTLVSLCTSIADPNWIQVQNRTDSNQLIYGVAFTLHAAQNLSNTGTTHTSLYVGVFGVRL